MINEEWRALSIAWVGLGIAIYMLYCIRYDFNDAEFIIRMSRRKRVLCKLGIIFLWPIWIPLYILFEMVTFITKVIWSIFL